MLRLGHEGVGLSTQIVGPIFRKEIDISQWRVNNNNDIRTDGHTGVWFKKNPVVCFQLKLFELIVYDYNKKRPVGPCCPPWLLTAVNKDSFESPKAGLFTSHHANKAEVCALMCGSTWGLADGWFAGRIGGKLAAFTVFFVLFCFFNLVANISYTKVPCCALRFQTLCLSLCSGAVAKKGVRTNTVFGNYSYHEQWNTQYC